MNNKKYTTILKGIIFTFSLLRLCKGHKEIKTCVYVYMDVCMSVGTLVLVYTLCNMHVYSV